METKKWVVTANGREIIIDQVEKESLQRELQAPFYYFGCDESYKFFITKKEEMIMLNTVTSITEWVSCVATI